jgi:hypothetical protein
MQASVKPQPGATELPDSTKVNPKKLKDNSLF